MRILTATILALAAAGAANAQCFVPIGGYDCNCHYVLEPSVAGFAATENAILTHGSIPAVSLYTSGIERVYNGKESITATIATDGNSVTIAGLEADASYEIFGTDGSLLSAGSVAPGGAISLPGSTAAYILRITPADSLPMAFRLLK